MDVLRGQRGNKKKEERIYAEEIEEKHYADEQTISLHCRVSGEIG